jgi:ribonucleotide reductase alpha subunit
MKRVQQDGEWTLFSPDDVPDLHNCYGHEFERRYVAYEALADRGEITLHRRVRAVDLWRKMLTALFETGHPWLTFKDPSNTRSAKDHAGVVHNSNLCTEILPNTSEEEVAVCNLGSINLVAHLKDALLDLPQLQATIRTAVRMLDNVIDLNYYPIPEARASNLRHRPISLGLMGFQDALYELGLSYASDEAVAFADRSMEVIAYFTILASTELARERGRYPVCRLEVGAGAPANRHVATARRRAGGVDRFRCVWRPRLDRRSRCGPTVRHAQQPDDGDRADSDNRQHPWRQPVHRAALHQPVSQEQSLRGVHLRQPLSRARPRVTRALGSPDA